MAFGPVCGHDELAARPHDRSPPEPPQTNPDKLSTAAASSPARRLAVQGAPNAGRALHDTRMVDLPGSTQSRAVPMGADWVITVDVLFVAR